MRVDSHFPTFKKFKNSLEMSLLDYLAVLLIFSLIFPIRKVFDTPESTLIGQYSDITSLSLYLSDILLFFTAIIGFYLKKLSLKVSNITLFLILAISLICIGNFDKSNWLMAYKALKWLEMITLFEIVLQLTRERVLNLKNIAYISTILMIFSSATGVIQVLINRSIGLRYLGESVLNPKEYGVGKYVAHGTKKLRAYGTFPHPNVLSVWLLAFFSLTTWCDFAKKVNFHRFIPYISTFFLVSAFFTFSRSTILVFLIFCLINVLYLFKVSQKWLKYGIFSIFTLGFCLFLVLSPAQNERTGESLNLRLIYNETALSMIKENPVFGVGFGESLLQMNDFAKLALEPWDVQPIHNFFLLSASEGGIIFAILLLAIILYPIILTIRSIWNMRHGQSLDLDGDFYNQFVLASLIFCFLLLMQVDHYFYTLQQGQFLLWIVLGLYYGNFVYKKPSA